MKLFFRKQGQGEPLLIIHGLYGSSDNWLAIAARLAEKYTVYTVDLRNHGHSPHHHEHTYAAMVNDLAEFFDDHKLTPAVILGHSMGGKTAMYFAALYPEKVKKLIIADIAPKNYMFLEDQSQYHFHRQILMALLEIDLSKIKTRRDVEDRLVEKIDNKGVIRFLLKNVEIDKTTHKFKWRLNIDAIYNNLEEIVEGVNPKWLDNQIPILVYPVVFIRGLNSHYIQDSDIPLIKKIYPEATVVDIPDAGHWLHAEQPDLFIKAVMNCC